MSPKLLFAFLSFLVAGTTAAPATGHGACVLQKDTVVEHFKLSTLTPLFGELLTTESNGNIYFVSVCTPVTQKFYDPRKLAGAVKWTVDGYSIDLGRIDISNVVVNENDIVLTYVGGDVDKNPKDTCKGLRWNTYVSFVCDPYTSKDVLTLIDEDPDQPEICQVWFEVRTQKICERQPYLSLHSLEKDLSNEEKEIHKKREPGRNEIYLNKIVHKDKSSNIENSQLHPHKISPKTEIKEKKLNETNIENQKHSEHNNSEHLPIIYVKPNCINEQESMNSHKKENKLNQYFPPKNDLFHYEHNNIVENNEKMNVEIENNKSTLTKPQDNLSINNSFPDYKSEPNWQDQQFRNKSDNTAKNEKSRSNENKSNNATQFMPKYHLQKKNMPWTNENNENSLRKNHESLDNKNENSQYGNKIYINKENYSNKNLPEGKQKDNTYYDFETNRNDNPTHLIPNNLQSKNKVLSDKTNIDDNSNQMSKSSEDLTKHFEEENKIKVFPEEISPKNHLNFQYENKTYAHKEDYSNKNLPEEKSSNNTNYDFETNKNNNSTQLIPNNQSSKNEVPSDKTNTKDNSDQRSKSPEDVNTNFEEKNEKNKINIFPEETSSRNDPNLQYENKIYVHNEVYSNKNLPEEKSSNNTHYDFETNKNDNSSQLIPNYQLSKNKIPSNRTNVYDNSDHKSKSPEDANTNFEEQNKITISPEETSPRNESQQNITNESTLEGKYFNENHYSQNKSSEIKPSNDENNNTSYKYPSNEENQTNLLNDKNSYSHELNHTSNNVLPLDNEQELKQNSTQTLNLENDHSKTLNSTNYEIKPFINSNYMNSQKNNLNESLSENNVKNSINFNKQHKNKNNAFTKTNNTYVENKTESAQENVSKSYNSTVNSEDITTGFTVKPPNNSQPNTTLYHPNEFSEVNNTQYIKTPVYKSKTNEIANEKQINSVPENTETTESSQPSSNQNSQDSNKVPNISNKILDTTDNNQTESSFSFSGLYSKLFPNGIQFSTATILGGLGSLSAVSLVVGAAVNRFYHKKTGADQIPLKGTFTAVFTFIKTNVSRIFCGCCGNLMVPGTSNERTPLLSPKNSPEPTAGNERKKRNIGDGSYNSSNNSDDDDSSGQNNKDGYGSMSNEEKSPIFGSIDVKKESSLSDKDVIDSGEAENVTKTEQNLKGKSNNGDGVLSKIFKSKVVPAVENIFERTGKKFDIIEGDKKETTKSAEKNTESPLNGNQKQKKADTERGVKKAVENVKNIISTADTSLSVKNGSDDTVGKEEKSVDDEPKITKKTTELSKSERKNSKDKIVEKNAKDNARNESNSLFQFVKPSVVSKTNEAKQKFFEGVGKDDGTEKDDRDASTKRADGDDSTTEYVEEIVYIDGKDGDQEGEEIVEEIVETTTLVDSPDSPSGGVTVTKTTRKVSSSANPGVVRTSEETVVSDDRNGEGKTRKRSFGLKLGIGKSGVNVSVGEKKMGVGLSGVKFGKKLDETDESNAMTVAVDGSGLKFNRGQRPENGDDASTPKKTPKKLKNALPSFKMFKRSTSQPAGSEAGEAADVFPHTLPQSSATIPRKTSRGSAGLLIFGKSRSRSTGFLETDDSGDAVTDVKALANFIDHERSASLQSLERFGSVPSMHTDGGNETLPVQSLENISAGSEGLEVKTGGLPKLSKKTKKKSDGERKSTKTSKK